MAEVGEEHPYEWVEPRRMGVLREYSQGPFVWLVSVVELMPRPGGGTTLVHRLRPGAEHLEDPRRVAMGGGRRPAQEPGERLSPHRRDRQGPGPAAGSIAAVDPFEEPARLPAPRRLRLDRLLDRLAERGVDAAVVERLGEHLARGSAQEVARIRPLALAERFGLDPDQVVAACLHGAREGLLELHWDLLCPVCRISCQVTDTLRAIAEHAHCVACHLDFRARLRQLDRADLPGASRDPRGRPGHLLRRRAGAFAARAGPGPRRAGRADRAGARAARGLVSAPRPAVALVGRLPGAAVRRDSGAGRSTWRRDRAPVSSRRVAHRRPGAGAEQRA